MAFNAYGLMTCREGSINDVPVAGHYRPFFGPPTNAGAHKESPYDIAVSPLEIAFPGVQI